MNKIKNQQQESPSTNIENANLENAEEKVQLSDEELANVSGGAAIICNLPSSKLHSRPPFASTPPIPDINSTNGKTKSLNDGDNQSLNSYFRHNANSNDEI